MSDPSIVNNAQTEIDASLRSARPWVEWYQPGVPAQLDIPDHPLTWLLDQTVSKYPHQTALIYYGTKISYARLSTLANRFAVALQRLGVQPGDRVAIALPNIPQYPIAFYGALKAGAVVVPTNPLYTEREMQHQLADSGARVLIMLDMFYPTVRAVRAKTQVEHILITSISDFLPPVLRTLYALNRRKTFVQKPRLTTREMQTDTMLHPLAKMLEPGTKGGVEVFNLPAPAASSDLAVLQYTGGTTGLSKGAMLTHRNLLANVLQSRCWTPDTHDAQEICLCVAPFFHSYGMTVCMNLSILAAATMVLMPRFSAKEVVKAIARYRPSLFPGIPTMYVAIMHEIKGNTKQLSSIKFCISGAAPLPAKVQEDFERMSGGKLVEGYGLSEASPVTHTNPLNENCVNGSIGLPLPNIEAMIMDRVTGKRQPPGEVGELLVRGPNIMQGYWNRDNKDVFYQDWLYTGDIAYMDGKGYFYIVDRSKDLIVASGFNVYPREVEEVLFQHQAVEEAAVIGIPDEYRGENVVAVIVLKPGFTASEEMRDSVVAHCKRELTAYKVPKIVEFRTSLPKSLIGKVLRRELRESFVQSQTK